MINTPIYLVPCDFSEVSDHALKLSLEIARINQGEIMLFHVIKDKSEKIKTKLRFQQIVDGLSYADKKIVTYRIIQGSLYDEVSKAIQIIRPAMVIMGTHGAKGMQKIFGSHIERIVSGSSSPLLITRGATELKDMKTIVMPFSFQRDSLQITTFAASMAKKFGATIHLVAHHDNNEVHEEAIAHNQKIVERFMEENEVNFEIINLPMEKSFDSELQDYAGEIHANVIAAAYTNDNKLTTNVHMQKIFENIYKIPVLTVNAEELS